MSTEKGLIVNEIFTSCWQGEGRQAGQMCTFIRLSRCNLNCAWCDTPYTWVFTDRQAELHNKGRKYDPTIEGHSMTPEAIDAYVRSIAKSNLVVISGGEPMLQHKGLKELLGLFWVHMFGVAIETAGTISPSCLGDVAYRVDQWNVSPKLNSSGNELKKRFNKQALKDFNDLDADFKFVCSDATDIKEAAGIQLEIGIPNNRMWIMPEGTDADTILKKASYLAPLVQAHKWNLTLRQHVLLYGDERGH